MDNVREDYDVGFAKPPIETQFAKGHSGNPKGRPKGRKNFATTFHQVTQELIHVRENGRDKTMTKLEAIMRQLIGKAMSGDFKATREILQWNRIFEDAVERNASDGPDAEKDAAVMNAFLLRIKAAQGDVEHEPISSKESCADDDVK